MVLLALVVGVVCVALLLTFVLPWIDREASVEGGGEVQPSLARFVDTDLGVAVTYPEGWGVGTTGIQSEGVVMSILSPNGSVVVDVFRTFPPPKPPDVDGLTHLNGYAQAVLDMEALDSPGFEVASREVIELDNGAPAVTAHYTIDDGSSLSGDILVTIRSRPPDEATPFGDEAFIVHAVGPTEPYLANAAQVRSVLTGFALVDDAGDTPGS